MAAEQAGIVPVALPHWATDALPPAAAQFVSGVLGYLEFASRGVLHSDSVFWVVTLGALWLAADFLRRGFRLVWPRRKVEGTFATAAILLSNMILGPFVALAAGALQQVYDGLNVPRIDPGAWNGVPAFVLVPFAILAYDFANYWNHRLMHTRLVWPVHAVHHSDPEMTGLTTFRVHVFEIFVMMASYTLLLSWLGFPPDVMGGAAVLLGLLNAYVHIDVDWGHGPFRYLLASPRFHKWHHADAPAAYGKNLANVFPFLDKLFGTYRVPGPCDVAVGAKGVPENDVPKLLLFPFVAWGQMARRAWRRRQSAASPAPAEANA
jgi:sterol desaturase/sphingolipid hydroxylase (fatty acid hydroxylase superfamily)